MNLNTIGHLQIALLAAAASLVGLMPSCTTRDSGSINNPKLFETDSFKNYWYAGKAEVNSYQLSQSRYGEIREGKAMLIFVTEDFSEKKQVKIDDPTQAKDKISVLKMNFTKNFVTGIYPYSMMLSVFSPINRDKFPQSLKVTMSSQEWCGHVFTQLNLNGRKYDVSSYSYFEKEGDETFTLKKAILEDELWSLIRLEPEGIPIGDFRLIPGLFWSRLNHTDLKILNANGTKTENGNDIIYRLSFTDQARVLTIRYQKLFPHKILGWEESFIERGKPSTTKAVLDRTLFIDYWKKNKSEFRYLRDSLGLSPNNF